MNGAFLAIKVGPIQFQPAEFAKLGIIVFLASYLRETGDILVRPRLRPLPYQRQLLLCGHPGAAHAARHRRARARPRRLGAAGVFRLSFAAVLRDRPSPKHFGPLLLVWGLAMLMLIFIRDLGSSLMFFGGFLALLYVATARLSLIGVGATMFFGGAFYLVAERRARRRSAWTSGSTRSRRASWTTRATSSRSRCSRRPTAGCSGRASARRCSSCPAAGRSCPRRTPT